MNEFKKIDMEHVIELYFVFLHSPDIMDEVIKIRLT